MPLMLQIPAARTDPGKDLEIRPKQVKAWLDAMPMAQPVEPARKVLAHLTAVNRSKVDTDTVLQILDVQRPVVAVLLEELEAVYGKAPQPLPAKARECLDLARGLTGEIAIGYKAAILAKTGKLIAFGAKKQLPLLVLRAMEALSRQLRAAYKSYTPAPQGVWAEVHQLYLFAEKEGIVGEPADPETRACVAELYCETLLLSLTDPYRLAQGECDKVVAQIRGARAPVTLSQAKPATRPGGHFLVPCDTDRPPKPALSASDDTGGPNWRLFDANPIVDKLRQRKQAFESGNVSATTSRMVGPDGINLLTKLIILWGDPPKRTSRRDPSDGTVAICVGLRAVGHFVSLEAQSAAEEAFRIKQGITIPLIVIPDDEVSRGLPVVEWDVVNQSAGGLKVRRSGPASQSLAVGEVVGIKFIGRTRWTVAVARWITALDDGGMEFGIQYLAPMARCVSVQPTVTSTSSQVRQGLVLIDEGGDPAATDILLCPPNTFSELREYEIEEDGNVQSVRARSLIEKTGRFDLFHVSPS